jgi:D-glycero-alpha-D-manno-heptose-7-phosphate kinase
MRLALEAGDWKETGRLMNVEWQFRKKSLPTISARTIDRIIDNSRHRGALAGKVCGAGGGGCVVLLIEPDARERVEKAVLESGGELLPMQIDRQGVTVVSQ